MILRVLLATGNDELFEMVHSTALQQDVVLTRARDPSQMWRHLRSEPCDLVVLDRLFVAGDPSIDFREIQSVPDAPEILVLLREDTPEERSVHLEAGALACIATGGERHTLHRTIRALVRRTKKLALQEFLAEAATPDHQLSDFASKSPAMRSLLTTARKVMQSDSSLLILGETGVGKEYLARAVHAAGRRSTRPFVAVNCGALSETLLESELFGHVAGAFTGAQKTRRGYFELAHSGTVFLDEIGELPLHLQVKLMRVLQEHKVMPVGAERTVEVDIRVMAATNRDLKAETGAGRFRSDLYYRLGVVTLTIPPLRQRREDIPDLVQSHLEHFRRTLGRPVYGVCPAALELLVQYDWPGNVRELINVVERAVLLAESEEITTADLPDNIHERGAERRGAVDELLLPSGMSLTGERLQEARDRILESFERRYLTELLQETGGRIGTAAKRAGITPRSLYEKMKRLGMDKASFKPRRVVGPRP